MKQPEKSHDTENISQRLRQAFGVSERSFESQIVENDDGSFVRVPLDSDVIEIYRADGARVYTADDFHPDEFKGINDLK